MKFPFLIKRRTPGGGYYPVKKREVSTETLEKLSSSPKASQMLYFYNKQNLNNQRVMVVDLDNSHEAEEEIYTSFKEMRKYIKCILLKSFSGFHIVIPLEGEMEDYRLWQSRMISRFFHTVIRFIDINVSLSPNYGFFHSQHTLSLLSEGTLEESSEGIRFTDCNIPENVIRVLSEELPESVTREICEFARRKDERSWKYLAVQSTRKFRTVLDAAQGRNDGEAILRNVGERKNERRVEESHTGVPRSTSIEGCRHKTIQGLFERLELDFDRRRDLASGRPFEGSGENPEECCLQGSGVEGSGYLDSSSCGYEGLKGAGFCGPCSPSYLLATLQAVKSLYVERDNCLVGLVDRISKNSLRVDLYRDVKSEESDFSVFFRSLRQAMERSDGQSGFSGFGPTCYRKWSRCSHVCLANFKNLERSVHLCSKITLEGGGLYLASHGFRFSGHRKPINPVSREIAIKVLEHIRASVYTYSGIYRPSSFRNLWSSSYENLVDGTQKFLGYLMKLSPAISAGEPIDIGLVDFQHFFSVPMSGAVTLRDLFIAEFSVKKGREYIPKVKRRSYYFSKERLEAFGLIESSNWNVLNPDWLASKLGNGNTWSSICRFGPLTLRYLGLENSVNLWNDALDKSTANDKDLRRKDVYSFLRFLDKGKASYDSDEEPRCVAVNS
jgi:hypothetical protein